MKKETKYNLSSQDIAKAMFWINAIPTFVAIFVFLFGVSTLIKKFDFEFALYLSPLLLGIISEIIYAAQIRFNVYSLSKKLWVSSIVINTFFHHPTYFLLLYE